MTKLHGTVGTGLVLLMLVGWTSSAQAINFQPETWYEILATNPAQVVIEPSTMRLSLGRSGQVQARAFWEYDLAEITQQFETITSASITITRLIDPLDRNNNVVQVVTYQADAIPPIPDDFNNNIFAPDTFVNNVLLEGDTIFDLTTGLQIAIENAYPFLGVGAFVPSTSLSNGVLFEIEGFVELSVAGTVVPLPPPEPIPEPSTMLLLASGLIGLGFFRRSRRMVC